MAVHGRPTKRRICSSFASPMAVHGRPAKRARVTAEPCLLDVRAFKEERARAGAFRANVRGFLSRYASPAAAAAGEWGEEGVMGAGAGAAWQVGFRVGEDGEASVVVMDVVEEDVPGARRVYCDHCTVAGWSRHPVCGKKYHFIFRNKNTPNCKTCRRCGLMVGLFETRAEECHERKLGPWRGFSLLFFPFLARGYGWGLRFAGGLREERTMVRGYFYLGMAHFLGFLNPDQNRTGQQYFYFLRSSMKPQYANIMERF